MPGRFDLTSIDVSVLVELDPAVPSGDLVQVLVVLVAHAILADVSTHLGVTKGLHVAPIPSELRNRGQQIDAVSISLPSTIDQLRRSPPCRRGADPHPAPDAPPNRVDTTHPSLPDEPESASERHDEWVLAVR